MDDEMMRVSGVPYPVPKKASDSQVGGDHYKRMGIEPWDVVDTWPYEQRVGAYRYAALKYLMRLGMKDEIVQESGKGLHCYEKLNETIKKGPNENA